MTEIRGPHPEQGPIGPHDKKMYEQEYRKGAELFQKALEANTKAENPYQKQQFEEVMNKAMMVMNETARELMRKELLKQNQQIEKDFAAYQEKQTPEAEKKLTQDLEKAKKSIS